MRTSDNLAYITFNLTENSCNVLFSILKDRELKTTPSNKEALDELVNSKARYTNGEETHIFNILTYSRSFAGYRAKLSDDFNYYLNEGNEVEVDFDLLMNLSYFGKYIYFNMLIGVYSFYKPTLIKETRPMILDRVINNDLLLLSDEFAYTVNETGDYISFTVEGA